MDGEHIDSGAARQSARMTEREFRAVARLGVDGAEREILRRVNDEHRASTEHERRIVAEVKDRGGICRPEGSTQEEWSNRLPRSLRGSKKHCVAVDEVGQEFADRGLTADAYQDTTLDYLATADVVVKSRAAPPDPKELRKAAYRLVDDKASRAAQDLVASSQELRCDLPKGEPMRGMAGMGGGLADASIAFDPQGWTFFPQNGLAQLGERAGLATLCVIGLYYSTSIVPKIVFGVGTAFFGALAVAKLIELCE